MPSVEVMDNHGPMHESPDERSPISARHPGRRESFWRPKIYVFTRAFHVMEQGTTRNWSQIVVSVASLVGSEIETQQEGGTYFL